MNFNPVPHSTFRSIVARSSGPYLIFLDYDGVLVPICDDREAAVLDVLARHQLRRLLQSSRVQLVVVSGRPKDFLDEQLRDLPVAVAAEHGGSFRPADRSYWTGFDGSDFHHEAYSEALRLTSSWQHQLPGSVVEVKEQSVAWHYRAIDDAISDDAVRKLYEAMLEHMARWPEVSVLNGKCIIEVRCSGQSKGAFVRWYVGRMRYKNRSVSFPIAIGDDTTDEEMFAAINEVEGFSVKVGPGSTCAKGRLEAVSDVYELLENLSTVAENL